ncbi:SAGA-associated factor 29 [Ixodes scapularis]|uniref:SAGA-associated factor 29 n=1 Tax=Ixodes scapularis TaxID=6945 RepID=UPI001A9FFD82|nr:SAGA-associated factor 29 [Ixodes scapularis]
MLCPPCKDLATLSRQNLLTAIHAGREKSERAQPDKHQQDARADSAGAEALPVLQVEAARLVQDGPLQDAESEEELFRKASTSSSRYAPCATSVALPPRTLVGDMVAALARGPDDDENWILAEVLHYNHGSCKYDVDDIDEEQKERHTLSRRRVVPLPLLRANPTTDPGALFPKGALVMALYPQTTCFYCAQVHEPPGGPQEDYLVLFEDSSYPEGYSPPLAVAQRYIICCKEMRKK